MFSVRTSYKTSPDDDYIIARQPANSERTHESTRDFGAGLALSATALAPLPALAQAKYPDRPIRLIVPFGAGGVVDSVGAAMGRAHEDRIGGTIVVENQGGAGGTIGMGEVARAQPDGYTLALGNTCTLVLNPAIMPKVPYDPARISPRSRSLRSRSAASSFIPRAGEEPQGIHRLRQGQPGQAVLWLGRRRNHDQFRRRAVQAAHRRAGDRARAL